MSLLRNGREVGSDQSPAFTAVFAAIDFTTSCGPENFVTISPIRETKRAELMFQACWEPAAEPLPVPRAVFAAVNLAASVDAFTPRCWIVLGGGDEKNVWIARMQNEAVGINVRSPFGTRPALPAVSAIEADVETGAAGD